MGHKWGNIYDDELGLNKNVMVASGLLYMYYYNNNSNYS